MWWQQEGYWAKIVPVIQKMFYITGGPVRAFEAVLVGFFIITNVISLEYKIWTCLNFMKT